MIFNLSNLRVGAEGVKPYFSISVFKSGSNFHAIEHLTDAHTQGSTATIALQRLCLSLGIDQGEIPIEDVEEIPYED